jgi:hypothetical protein
MTDEPPLEGLREDFAGIVGDVEELAGGGTRHIRAELAS